MSGGYLNWDQLPEAVVDAFNEPPLPGRDAARSAAATGRQTRRAGAATNNSTESGSAPSVATCSVIGNADLAACCSIARGPPRRESMIRRYVPSC